MSNNLNIVSDNKFDFIDIEKESGFVAKNPTCTIKHQTISLSVSTCKELKLESYNYCHISSLAPLDETSKLYLRFNNNEPSNSNFKLVKEADGYVRSGALISGTTVLCRKVPRYNAILKMPTKHRRIELGFCSDTGLMFIPLGPLFEKQLRDINNPPEDKAIYKILYNGNILNIGETNNLSRRIKEKKNEGMKMHEVYYSPMNTYSDDVRKNWEAFHIEEYVKQYGSLPPENRQKGREIN